MQILSKIMKYSLALTLLSCISAWAADPVPLDVKTGQWEITVTTQMNGVTPPSGKMPSLSPDQISKLPPEQRARLEGLMKGMGGAPVTNTNKTCVKAEDLTKMHLNNDRMGGCKTTITSATRTKQEAKMDCELAGGKQTGTTTVEAVNSESFKFNFQMEGTNATGQPLKMTMNGTSKWLGPTCSESK